MVFFNYNIANKLLLLRLCQMTTALIYLILAIVIFTSSNIKVFFFNKDLTQSIFLLFVLLLILVLLTMKPLFTLSNGSIWVLLVSLIVTLYSLFIFSSILNWYASTVEGPISFKFLKLVMIASFDTKANAYFQELANGIDVLAKHNADLYSYLKNSTKLNNIIPEEIISCKLQDIAFYTQEKLQTAVVDYNQLVEQARARGLNSGSQIDYKKILIIGACLLGAGLALYFFKDDLTKALAKLGLRGQRLATDGYGHSQELAQATLKVSKDVETLAIQIKSLSGLISNLMNSEQEHAEQIATLISRCNVMSSKAIAEHELIRGLFQINFKVYVPMLTNTLGSMNKCLSSLTHLQKEYLKLDA